MKGGFEDLKALDANRVYEETHVSQVVFNNIINKQFADLKPVQAKGLIKVLENAYNIDLSLWLLDYDDYLKGITPKISSMEKLTVESKEIQKKAFPKSWIVIPIIVLLVGFFFFSLKDNIANDINETNLSAQTTETTIATLLNVPIESNSTTQIENNVTDYNSSNTIINDSNATILPNNISNIRFEIIPRHKLWLGIYYLDDNKSDFRDDVNQTTILNPTRPQILVMGPAFVSVKLGDAVVDSNHDGVVRYIYYPTDKKIKYITKQEFENIRPPKKSQAQH